jgi:hypothetical protein
VLNCANAGVARKSTRAERPAVFLRQVLEATSLSVYELLLALEGILTQRIEIIKAECPSGRRKNDHSGRAGRRTGKGRRTICRSAGGLRGPKRRWKNAAICGIIAARSVGKRGGAPSIPPSSIRDETQHRIPFSPSQRGFGLFPFWLARARERSWRRSIRRLKPTLIVQSCVRSLPTQKGGAMFNFSKLSTCRGGPARLMCRYGGLRRRLLADPCLMVYPESPVHVPLRSRRVLHGWARRSALRPRVRQGRSVSRRPQHERDRVRRVPGPQSDGVRDGFRAPGVLHAG